MKQLKAEWPEGTLTRIICLLKYLIQGIIYPGLHSNLRVNSPLLQTKVSLTSPKLRCTRLAYHTLAVPASRHRRQRLWPLIAACWSWLPTRGPTWARSQLGTRPITSWSRTQIATCALHSVQSECETNHTPAWARIRIDHVHAVCQLLSSVLKLLSQIFDCYST